MYSRQLPPISKRRVGSRGVMPPGRRQAGSQPGHGRRGIAVGHTKMPAKPLRRSPLVLDESKRGSGTTPRLILRGGSSLRGGGGGRQPPPFHPWHDGLRAQTVEARGKTSRA